MRLIKASSIFQDIDGSSMVRCFSPLDALARQNLIELKGRLDYFSSDVVIFQRSWTQARIELMKSLQRHGIRCVVDLDDDILNVPKCNPAFQEYSQPSFQATAKKLLKTADGIFCSTKDLVDKYKFYNKTFHIPNGVDLTKWEPRKFNQNLPIRVGFAGSVSHIGDLDLLNGTFLRLAERYGNHLRFCFFGTAPTLLFTELGTRFHHLIDLIDNVKVLDYPDTLRSTKIDIGLVPLVKNSFNQSRSNLKWLEYTAIGAVTIASCFGAYSELTDRQDAMLIRSNSGWFDSISELVNNQSLRRDLLASASESASKFSVDASASSMLDAFYQLKPELSHVPFILDIARGDVSKKISVIVPVYNAYDDVKRCLDSVVPQLTENSELVVVDDCSPDPRIFSYLQTIINHPGVKVVTAAKTGGFVQSCNLGNRKKRLNGDIILLNSDTLPTTGFIERLSQTAYANPKIGTVTAVTNHGSISSVPYVSDSSSQQDTTSQVVISPTAVGHCMYIKKEVLSKYGLFDTIFARGYGEENDLSMRIREEYWNVIDPGCFVWHKGSSSFGYQARNTLEAEHMEILNKRYPSYLEEVQGFKASDPLHSFRKNIIRSTKDTKKRILNISHNYRADAGTEKHIKDLAIGLKDSFLSFTVAPWDHGLEVFQDEIPLSWAPYNKTTWPIAPSRVSHSRKALDKVIDEVSPDLIHVHHLLNHPLGLLDDLANLSIPFVVSIHDYYLICPDYTLRGCPGTDQCSTCFVKHFNGAGQPEYQEARRSILGNALTKAAKIIAPSHFAANKILEVYPHLKIDVILHGINSIVRNVPEPTPKVRFGYVGNLTPQKGIDLLLSAWQSIPQPFAAELHLFGAASNSNYTKNHINKGIFYHGKYKTEDLPAIFSQFDVGVIPSDFPETYCYTLSELQSAGLPIVCSDIGSLTERVSESNGWKVTPGDIEKWKECLQQIVFSKSWLTKTPTMPRTLVDMSQDYKTAYQTVISGKKPPSFKVLL